MENTISKEEIKKILPKVIERKKTRRRPTKRKNEEDEDEDDKDWADTGRKRSSPKFHCPDIGCEATFSKEVS